MKFDNPEYKNLNEFSLLTLITEQPGFEEDDMGYIVLVHSKAIRYFYKIENNKELFKKLKELAYINYGNHLERNH